MKKLIVTALFLTVCVVNLFALAACNNSDNGGNMDTAKIEYEDIYRNEIVKSAPISGASLYKASYGYNLCLQQGYNAFYYRYGRIGNYSDMSLKDGKWTGGGASIDGGYMKSDGNTDAVRDFTVPVTAQAHIYGNPYLTDGTQATVSIYVNGSRIFESTLTDDTGVYHSDKVSLTAGQTVSFAVSGSAGVYWNPSVDFTMAEEKQLHHTVDGYYGDVHPFYDEKTKKLYMYYLSTGRQSGNVTEQFSSMLTTSGNFVQYNDTKIRPDSKNPPEQELYYVLGVYRDKDGNYRSSFGYGNYAGATLSTDLINWQTGSDIYIDEADGFLKYTYRAYFDSDVYSGRDPDVMYDKQSGKYYCVVMNYYTAAAAGGAKSLALYTAGQDGKFSTKATKLVDFTGRGDPECPQLKKIGDRWYLFYSVYGTGSAGNVGNLTYRVGDAGVSVENVDWNSKTEYALDGGDLHAAQLCEVGDKYYMYGWINYSPHANVWGGYLNLAREVYRKADGTLASRCDSYLTNLLNFGRVAAFNAENTSSNGMTVSGGAFSATADNAFARLEGEYGRSLLFAHIDLPQNAGRAGYTLSSGGTTYYIGLQRSGGRLYLSVSTNADGSGNGCRIEIRDSHLTSFDLKIVADGNFIEAFVNDEYSLSANTRLNGAYSLGIFAGNGAMISGADVCKLADYNNIFD